MKKKATFVLIALLSVANIALIAQERVVPYNQKPWQPTIWPSDPPAGCHFEGLWKNLDPLSARP